MTADAVPRAGQAPDESSDLNPSGAEVISQFLLHSPFVRHLGVRLESIEDDHARLVMPYRDELATIGDVVHGGALCALVDTAAMAASWSAHEVSGPLRGTTVGLSVDFVAPARGLQVTADARVVKRGKSLCFCDVDVTDAAGGLVAKGIVTYKLG
jgi:uncharacterized protein (TIGR00369 family)